MMMKYTSLLLISVISVFLIPVIQNASAQDNNKSAGQPSTSNSSNPSNIQSNAASYPGNISNAGNNNVSKNNPIGEQLQNLTKGVTNTLGKLLNMGNNSAK